MSLTPAQQNRADVINDIIRRNRRIPGSAYERSLMPYQLAAYRERSEWHELGDLRPLLEQHVRMIDLGYAPPRHSCDHYRKTFTMAPGESMGEYVDRVLTDVAR